MPAVLVVDAMHLRPLEDEAYPPRRPDVGVVEKFAERGEGRVDRAGLQIETEKGVDDQRSEDRVHRHLQRVLVERRDHLDPLRTVMDLMESEPQQVDLVPPAVPPVKDE